MLKLDSANRQTLVEEVSPTSRNSTKMKGRRKNFADNHCVEASSSNYEMLGQRIAEALNLSSGDMVEVLRDKFDANRILVRRLPADNAANAEVGS
jgi:hypothetical protein